MLFRECIILPLLGGPTNAAQPPALQWRSLSTGKLKSARYLRLDEGTERNNLKLYVDGEAHMDQGVESRVAELREGRRGRACLWTPSVAAKLLICCMCEGQKDTH